MYGACDSWDGEGRVQLGWDLFKRNEVFRTGPSIYIPCLLAQMDWQVSSHIHIKPLKGFLVCVTGQYQKQWLVSLEYRERIQENKNDMQNVYNLVKVNADYNIHSL
jgi:hypothetical protein